MIYLIILILQSIVISQLHLELIGDDFDKPIFAISDPINPDIIFVVEQDGYIWILDDEKSDNRLFLDITDRVHLPLFPADERGLLGFAFDPNYNDNGYVYVNYVDKDDNTIISRFFSRSYFVDISTEVKIIEIKQPYSNHNGGHIAFGQDSNLYISVGDGGSAGDPENRAQDLTNFFGSILRIKVLDNGQYDIPNDNPFILEKNKKNEIWAYGLRNVWRFSFDSENGDIYMGDVGQNSWEEINYQSVESNNGLNYGWNFMEASHCFPEDLDCRKEGLISPLFEYPNDAKYVRTIFGLKQKNVHGCSITGGYVYRGKNISDLYGRYIFGDYCSGKIWSINHENGDVNSLIDHTNELLGSINKEKFYLSSFGETSEGELLVVDYSGDIYLLKKDNKDY